MDLWIRSQDKKWLTKCDCIQYTTSTVDMEDVGLKTIDGNFLEDKGLLLGKYKTQERALEVLDEIHNSIKSSYKIIATAPITEIEKEPLFIKSSGIELKSEQQQVVIYEMPEE